MSLRVCKTLLFLALWGTIGCATTVYNGYPGGTLKYSEVKYSYTAKPVVTNPAGSTYLLKMPEGFSSVNTVPALDKRGMRHDDKSGDIMIIVKTGAIKHEPGAMGAKKSFRGVLISTLPIKLEVRSKGGKLLFDRTMDHQEVLQLEGEFKSKKEATEAV